MSSKSIDHTWMKLKLDVPPPQLNRTCTLQFTRQRRYRENGTQIPTQACLLSQVPGNPMEWKKSVSFNLFYRLDGLAIAPTRCAASRASCTVFTSPTNVMEISREQNTKFQPHPELSQVRFQQTEPGPGLQIEFERKESGFFKSLFLTGLTWKSRESCTPIKK